MNEAPQERFGAPAPTHPLLLEVVRVAEMRSMLHELANVFTGILITSGLLAEKLKGNDEAKFAQSLSDLGERGSGLVHDARALLLGALALEVNTSGEREG